MRCAVVLPWMMAISLAALAGCSSFAYDERATAIDVRKTLVADISEELLLDIPAGDVEIEPSEDGRLHVSLTYYCGADSEKCLRMAQDAEIVHAFSGRRSTISFQPGSAFAARHAEMVYLFQVPPTDRITVNMTAGDLDIRRLNSCVSVVMGAGEVNVLQPAGNVRSVTLDANFGDATLYHPDGRVDNRRKLLVGAESSWRGGSGPCDSHVNLQAGEISYRLTD